MSRSIVWGGQPVLWAAMLTLLAALNGCEKLKRPTRGGQSPATSSDTAPASPPAAPVWDAQGIADFAFTDRTGETVTKADLLGRPWVVGFIFTRCMGPCPRVTAEMRRLREQTGVQMVTITVDPEVDDQDTLRRFSKAYAGLAEGREDQWYFLTGDKAAIYNLIHRSFKMPVQETLGEDRIPGFEVIHSTNLMLVDAGGRVTAKFNALKDEEVADLRRRLERIPRDVRLPRVRPPRVQPAIPDDVRSAVPAAAETPAPATPPTITPPSETLPAEAPATPDDLTGAADSTGLRKVVAAKKWAKTGYNRDELGQIWAIIGVRLVPKWVYRLPAINASLNGLATVLLLVGYMLVKRRHLHAHKWVMLSAFTTSIVFLGCYLVYHAHVGSRPFPGTGALKAVYLTILVTHIILAAAVPVLAICTIYRGLKGQWAQHLRIARITFPIWLYVSVTGVIIYLMLYHWPISSAAVAAG